MRRTAAFMLSALIAGASLSSCDLPRKNDPRPKTVLDLDSGWKFREAGGDGEWLPATVPGTVHTDLFAAGAIPDPFYGDNEKDLQWIGEKEWIYTCTFDAADSLFTHDRIFIEFEGLDTYAEVTLNGERLFSATNMFRKWNSRIESLLKKKENTLVVRFLPPGPIEAEKRAAFGDSLPGGDRVFTRKAAYHYGWDWGPRFITCGIWKPVRVTGWSDPRITKSYRTTLVLSDERAIVRFTIDVRWQSQREVDLILVDKDDGTRRSQRVVCGDFRNSRKINFQRFDFEFRIPDPQLWWPAGLGEQALRRYTIEVRADSVLLDSVDFTFGLRTMELITEKDASGESFYMKINGVPVFMKGANWIPMDSFLPRRGPGDYRRLLAAAKDANMNMLRVWGGGIYENDIFYDLCDSLGIIVWQDFMYACAMYPGDQKFLANANREAQDNVTRLRDHTCLALWCGNNEISEGWRNWGWQDHYSPAKRETMEKAYDNHFGKLLPGVVKSFDTDPTWSARSYLPSSPRFGRADPRSLTEGDAHYWGVWHDAEPFKVFEEKIPRFMSEFGFQSLPSMRTIGTFTAPGDRRLDSEAMLAHQKHPRGYGLIREYMERWYRVPEKFEDYVYVSQLLQAEGMRAGFTAQRRAMPYCMGSLYWQLNDCWPAVSWSSIDYGGEWKALHYAARRAFEPVLVSAAARDGRLDLYIVSDRLDETGGWMTMKLRRFDGTELWDRTIAVKAPPNASSNVFSVPLDVLLSGADRSAVVFSAEFDCPGEKPPVEIFYFVHPRDMKLPRASIEYEIIPCDRGATLEMTCARLAKNVFLQLDGCHFSDNFFDILPGETVTVTIETDIPADEIKDRLGIKTLRDTY